MKRQKFILSTIILGVLLNFVYFGESNKSIFPIVIGTLLNIGYFYQEKITLKDMNGLYISLGLISFLFLQNLIPILNNPITNIMTLLLVSYFNYTTYAKDSSKKRRTSLYMIGLLIIIAMRDMQDLVLYTFFANLLLCLTYD